MATRNIKEFLEEFTLADLKRRGVLKGKLLKGKSVEPLIDLMRECGVERVEYPDADWFLDTEGKFMNPYSPEQKKGKTDELSKMGSVFTRTNSVLNPHCQEGTEQEDEEAEEMANIFRLEKDLQAALRKNIEGLEPGLKIVDDDRERAVEGGRIDITAEDKEGRIVVIELKAGKAKPASIGQIQFYMQSLAEEEQKAIRGILVAGDFDKKVIVAARGISNLELKQYSVSFSFKNH